jgi:hypothetical protein
MREKIPIQRFSVFFEPSMAEEYSVIPDLLRTSYGKSPIKNHFQAKNVRVSTNNFSRASSCRHGESTILIVTWDSLS